MKNEKFAWRTINIVCIAMHLTTPVGSNPRMKTPRVRRDVGGLGHSF